MARSFAQLPTQPYIGTPYKRPIAICTPLQMSPNSVPIMVDWSLYGVSSNVQRMGVQVDLSLGQTGALLDRIRSVYIDNTFSDIAIYVQFPDTGMTIVCPPGAVTMQPVLTQAFKAIIYGEGFTNNEVPTNLERTVTNVTFMNIDVAGYYIPTAFEVLPDLTFLQGYDTPALNNAVMTFLNVPLGVQVDDRLSIFTVNWSTAGVGTPRTLNSVTVNGVPASLDANPTTIDGGAAIVACRVPVATSATVVCTFSGAVVLAYLGSYRLVNQQSDIPVIGISQGVGSTSRQLSLGYPANAVGVYSAMEEAILNATNIGWNNATENFEVTQGGSPGTRAGASAFYEAIAPQLTRTVTATCSGAGRLSCMAGAVWR